MLKIFALILAWIGLSSCYKNEELPPKPPTCGYKIYMDSAFGVYPAALCTNKPNKNKDGAYECLTDEGKNLMFSDFKGIEEGCW